MLALSILEIRKRLGKLMQPLLTDTFATTYEAMSQKLSEREASVAMVSQLEETLKLVDAVMDSTDEGQLNAIYTSVQPLTIFSFFMRYHIVTQLLIAEDQDGLLSVPLGDKEFLVTMLFHYIADRLRYPEPLDSPN